MFIFPVALIAADTMRHFTLPILAVTSLLHSTWCADGARAQSGAAGELRIEWQVKNRFRLFRNEADFMRQVRASRGDGVLAAERRLARETDGRGWARDVVERLCVDRSGSLLETCERDGERESFLTPRDHRIGAALAGTVPANARCVWSFVDGDGSAREVNAACEEEIKLRVRYGHPTHARVSMSCRTARHGSWKLKFRCATC